MRDGRVWRGGWVALALLAGGCGGDARVELSAADALTAVAGELRTALDEYHGEVEQHDDGREAAVAQAFVARARQDAADDAKLDGHTAAFTAALAKIRVDRMEEWKRRTAAESQLEAITEIAGGLQRIGIESLTLQDEMRRYLQTYLEAKQKK